MNPQLADLTARVGHFPHGHLRAISVADFQEFPHLPNRTGIPLSIFHEFLFSSFPFQLISLLKIVHIFIVTFFSCLWHCYSIIFFCCCG